MTMNENEQRIAIAKSIGWEWHESAMDGYYVAPDKTWTVRSWQELPDYLNDLNAMNEAEQTLKGTSLYDSPWFRYVRQLHEMTLGQGERAKARERAEAFLRTIGKWQD